MVNMINLVRPHLPHPDPLLTPLQGIVTLLLHPQQLANFKSDPTLAAPFVEELSRYHTASAMATRRVAKVDITLNGQVFSPSAPTSWSLF